MKKNLFLSICSLLVTTFLLVFLVFGWYVSNTEVSASGILGSTAGEPYEVELEVSECDASGNVTAWHKVNDIKFNNINPGDKFLFRLNIKLKEAGSLNLKVTFDEILSSVDNSKITVKDNKVYQMKGDIPLYDLVGNSVKVNEKGTEKTLYSYNESTLGLVDYKLEDAFKVYNLGAGDISNNNIPSSNLGINLSEGNGYDIVINEVLTHYNFILEFNEELSNKEIDGFVSSNMFLYQIIKIGRISLLK